MMSRLKSILRCLIQPRVQSHWTSDLILAIPRVLCGFWLTTMFGADKFGMPWTAESQNLNLFEVSAWFPEDVAGYGGLFATAPVFFAWMGAFSEAVGGLFLMLGLKTRVASFLIMCTMLVAIFMQKWNQGLWGILPAMGFLWVAIYNLVLGSGRFGLDFLVSKKLNKNLKIK
ncbi:DoxX family protein [uncultured Psychroserpens sp.]|uniref:DoxX family protein n=1 Tax=uncultured Psychroserpens sp. TaxID=255436 RepID=UPI002627652D|nr:DoxX family protein [uncultured Psychroserpens sp.]